MHQFLSEMIFMSEEKLVPKLRFPDFEHNWESKKLKDLSNIQRGASPRPITAKKWYDNENKKVGWVRIGDVTSSSKYLTKTEDYFSEEGVKKSRFLPKGSLIMSICATIGKPIVTGMDTCIHDGFVGFSELKNINKEFLYYYLNILEPKFISLSQTGSQANLNSDLVRNAEIGVPSIQEQEKIVNFISAVDKKHNILNKNLETQLSFKRYLMQQIFTQKLRFENYNEAIYKLSDLYSSKKGTGLSKDKLDEEGLNKCILYGELYTTYNEIIQDVKSKTNSQEGILSKVGDILIPSSTTTKGIDLVTASVILEENVLLSGDITILRSKNENIINNKFFAYYFTNNLVKDVSKLTQGSTIIHLYWKDFKKVKLALPPINEQNKCVDLFLKLDKKIDLINFQIQKMEEFKKGLLQQMFV